MATSSNRAASTAGPTDAQADLGQEGYRQALALMRRCATDHGYLGTPTELLGVADETQTAANIASRYANGSWLFQL